MLRASAGRRRPSHALRRSLAPFAPAHDVSAPSASAHRGISEKAPSHDLRKWYGHEPTRYREFAARYRDELAGRRQDGPILRLLELVGAQPVVLLTATHDVGKSQAPILAEFLTDQATAESESPPIL